MYLLVFVGVYRRVANICMGMIKQAVPEGMYDITEINAAFLKLSSVHPLLTLQWCYILILLNYDDQNWWSSVLQTPRKYRMSNQALVFIYTILIFSLLSATNRFYPPPVGEGGF